MTPTQMHRLMDLRRQRCDAARAALARTETDVAQAARALRRADTAAREARAAHGFAASQGLEEMVGRTTSAGAIAALSHRIDQLALAREDAEAHRFACAAALDTAQAARDAAAAEFRRLSARRDGWAGECDRIAARDRRRREITQDDERVDGHAVQATRRT